MKSSIPRSYTFKMLPVTVIAFLPLDVYGACDLTSTAGDDVRICDSGISGALTDLGGNNTLLLPAGGTGSITGSVTYGDGQDTVEMSSGSIDGSVNQAGAADRFTMLGGLISTDINQGSGTDTFEMSGGTLRSLAQGDGLDRFTMTGGTISNAFEDGDVAAMSGGTIGRVDMKLDNNLFDLSGGRIIGNLVAGFGRDTIIVSGGSIGGAISVSGGDDQVSISGGEVQGEIRTSFGNDRFNWANDGYVRSSVLLADGDDTALLDNLDETGLSATPLIDGGPGIDQLTFTSSTSSTPQRYSFWETVTLNEGSRLALNGPFTLGDAASGTGIMQIDASSSLASTSGSVVPFLADRRVTLNNAGTLDMTTGSSVATDTLRVNGDYVGNNGQLWLQSVLGDDASASDRLIVAQGRITGSTQLSVENLGGLGALTRLNGIEVVQATAGATSDSSAFSLKNSLSVGAYQYYLFKGGATAGSENSWFLRSSVVSPRAAPLEPITPPSPPPTLPVDPPAPAPDPVLPGEPPFPPAPPQPAPAPLPALSLPVPAAGTPPLPAAAFDAAPVPLYRLEVPTWSVVPPAAAILTLESLGTFHERHGDQSLLSELGAVPAGWARLIGNDFRQQWSGTVAPSLDASLSGFQIGHDLFALQTEGGRVQRGGLFVAHSQLKGHVKGFAEGAKNRRSGKLDMDGDSIGAYWTLVDPTGWYVDAVIMGTRLEGEARSERGLRVDTDGHGLSASIEGGYPLRISSNWVAEPQAQLIHQRIDLDSQDDGISHLSFDAEPRTTGRIGGRLKGRYPLQGMVLEPYLRTNLWRTFGGEDRVTFDHTDRIETRQAATRADLGLGITAQLSEEISIYASSDYSQNLDSEDYRGLRGSLGVRMSW